MFKMKPDYVKKTQVKVSSILEELGVHVDFSVNC